MARVENILHKLLHAHKQERYLRILRSNWLQNTGSMELTVCTSILFFFFSLSFPFQHLYKILEGNSHVISKLTGNILRMPLRVSIISYSFKSSGIISHLHISSHLPSLQGNGRCEILTSSRPLSISTSLTLWPMIFLVLGHPIQVTKPSFILRIIRIASTLPTLATSQSPISNRGTYH